MIEEQRLIAAMRTPDDPRMVVIKANDTEADALQDTKLGAPLLIIPNYEATLEEQKRRYEALARGYAQRPRWEDHHE